MVNEPEHYEDILDDETLSEEDRDQVLYIRDLIEKAGGVDFLFEDEAKNKRRLSLWMKRRPRLLLDILLTLALFAMSALASFQYSNIKELRERLEQLPSLPSFVEIFDQGREAVLYAADGTPLSNWSSAVESGIRQTNLLRGEENLALIGYDVADTGGQGALVAYRTIEPFVEAWRLDVDDAELPESLIARGFTGRQFSVNLIRTEDIFPQSPGIEVVVAWQHRIYSACTLRIFSATGELLYEVWNDGNIHDIEWVAKENLLVFSGFNSEVDSDKRGIPAKRWLHAWIIVGLTPEIARTGPNWIETVDHPGVRPVFYKCLFSQPAIDQMDNLQLSPAIPGIGYDHLSHFRCSLLFEHNEQRGKISMVLNASGEELDNERVLSDHYLKGVREGVLPSDDNFWWDALIPITR